MKSRTIATIAGTGEPGYSGDDQPAIHARLCEPKGVALDQTGNLFIADSENHVVRQVNLRNGLITTIAGTGAGGSEESKTEQSSTSSQGLDEDPLAGPFQSGPERFAQLTDVSGTVRFVVGKAQTVRAGGDGGPAVSATLNFPSAVAVDAGGHLYIADTFNHRVRKVDARTGIITAVAGTGQRRFSGDGGAGSAAALNEPVALAVDRQRLYIADQNNHRVRLLDLKTGIITTVAGTGEATYNGDGIPAIEAALAGPSGLAVGADGALYIADTFNGRIRRIDPENGLIHTVAGDGGEYRYQGVDHEVSVSLSRPYGVAVESSGNLLITDSDSHLIRRWDCHKKIVIRVAGNGVAQFGGDEGLAQESSLNFPFGVAVDPAGNIYIADTFNHRIRMIAA
jgi:sugar lactone lactonase YvrE